MRAVATAAVWVVLLGIASPCGATIRHVTSEYATIQAAIDAASEGDTVLVASGTYTGVGNRGLDFGGTNLVVMSEAGASATVIDCENQDRGFFFRNGESSASVVKGLTITHGLATVDGISGGGIMCVGCSPEIEDCIFSDCSAPTGSGGGIDCVGTSTPTITNCVFFGNEAKWRGGGIGSNDASVTITNCTLYSNSVTDAAYGGAAIDLSEGYAAIEGCTIAKNSTAGGAAGIRVEATCMITRTIFFCNEGGPAVFCEPGWGVITTYSLVLWNGPAEGGGDDLCGTYSDILNVHPFFCDFANDDYSVCAASPCLPANNEWGVHIGAWGEGCTVCTMGTERETWGAVKALYR